jgi:hypothetical protein
MFLSCVGARRGDVSDSAAVKLSMEISHTETVAITAGTSEVLAVTDSVPGEISVFLGDGQKVGKLFIDLSEFEFARPCGGLFSVSKSVMWLRRPSQLLNAREFAATNVPATSIVLTLVIMRLTGDPRRDSIRNFRVFAEKLSTPSPRPAPAPLKAAARAPLPGKENVDPDEARQALERRLAEKDAEIEELRREISRLRVRVEERLMNVARVEEEQVTSN